MEKEASNDYIYWSINLLHLETKYLFTKNKNKDVVNTYKNIGTKIIEEKINKYKYNEKSLIDFS